MGATQTEQGSAMGQWILIMVSILGAVLIIALIWSLYRALNNSSPQGSVAPANEATTMNTALSQEEIEKQFIAEHAEQRTEPVTQALVAAQAAVVPTKQTNDAVILQKAKTKVNQRIIERMKQYIRDNPNADTWAIQEQIKKREKRDTQSQ